MPELTAAPPINGDAPALIPRRQATLFSEATPLKLESGQTLGPITVDYQTYGTLSPRKDNAIFICHALTGDSHVAGRRNAEDRKPGWWDGFVGPGKGIDTDRYFVICANVLGGCQGTTGPNSVNPQTGELYGPSFPFITVADLVKVHVELCNSLGIERLLAVAGGSLGGMQVLEWAVQEPDRIASALVLASGSRLSAQGIAFNAVGRRAIVSDPSFNGGNFYGQSETPRFGLALARMIAHITYLSEQAIEAKFGRRLQNRDQLRYMVDDDTEFQIESYLNYQGKRFVERFDANSYLRLTRAMDYFDLERDHGPMSQSLAKSAAKFLVVSYTTDWLFPTEQSRAIVRALVQAQRHVTFTDLTSPHGHDAFLIESELPKLARLVSPFLDRTYHEVSSR
jgi:homoserine O-acetyltransferase